MNKYYVLNIMNGYQMKAKFYFPHLKLLRYTLFVKKRECYKGSEI